LPFDEDAEAYYHATAKTDDEVGKLIDEGFNYVLITPQGTVMFRKRK